MLPVHCIAAIRKAAITKSQQFAKKDGESSLKPITSTQKATELPEDMTSKLTAATEAKVRDNYNGHGCSHLRKAEKKITRG